MRLTTLRGEAFHGLTVRADQPLRAAMKTMNDTGRTLLVVVSEAGFVGVLADGDVRRYLAGTGGVDDAVSVAVNTKPITLPADTAADSIRNFMARRGLGSLPLLDAGGSGQAVALCMLETGPRTDQLSAVVIAGGIGSRLAPLTDDCPKPLLPLGDRPILAHIVEHLNEQGVNRFVMAVNYLAHMIVDHFDDGTRWDSFIEYVHETSRLGTGGALSLVDPEALSDPFLCLNGDIVSDIDVDALREAHLAAGWEATMVLSDYSMSVPYGVVETGSDGEVTKMVEKPVQQFQINAGVYMLSKSALDVVPREQVYDLPTLFADLQRAGRRTGTFRHHGRWIDIGSMSEYERAQRIFDGREPE